MSERSFERKIMRTCKTSSAVAQSFENRKFTKAKTIAAKLEVHPKTIFRWADAGHIGRFKVNARTVLFDEAEVIAFIDNARIAQPRVNARGMFSRKRRASNMLSNEEEALLDYALEKLEKPGRAATVEEESCEECAP